MAYIKYKEVTKYFNFSKYILLEKLPKYVKDYVYTDEIVLASYKTSRDYGVFTDKKIILFDNKMTLTNTKEVYTIPYKSISTISIVYKAYGAEMSLFLDSGYPLRLKYINMRAEDKLRLRLLYNIICRIINNQKEDIIEKQKLIDNNIIFDK